MRRDVKHGVGDAQVPALAAAQRGLHLRPIDLQLREEDRGVGEYQGTRDRLKGVAADDSARAAVEGALVVLVVVSHEALDEVVAAGASAAEGVRAPSADRGSAGLNAVGAALAAAHVGSGSRGLVFAATVACPLHQGRGDYPDLATLRIRWRSHCQSRTRDLSGQGVLNGQTQLRMVPLQPRRCLGLALLEDLQERGPQQPELAEGVTLSGVHAAAAGVHCRGAACFQHARRRGP
mmetsp:Transcript_25805/g.81949  ORF Transcript_25805/g.81949 Transcript_25805/m.81949 type:complete len:235 (+) Transcript_25805:1056-1760(+)